jgi:CubicO group peptidase (beta-lactamase class C family)
MPLKTKQPTGELRDTLAAEAPRLLKERHVEGISIALVLDREIVLAMGFGLRNSVTRDPITPQSMFEAYSLTKPLVAYRALDLCQQGALELDRPLDNYLSASYICDDHRARLITARMILTHKSGLPDEDTERHIAFTPGEGWLYSTQGFCYLQRVIDHVCAESFDENMRRHILSPLSMASSSFVWEDRFEPVMAQGHNAQGTPQIDRQIRVADADSLLTTASDYAKFVVECLRPEPVDGNGSARQPSIQMTQTQVAVADSLSWGLGWGIEETDDGPFFWHLGGGAGAPFQNFVLASRLHGLGIVMLTNSANGGALFEPIVEWLIGGNFSVFKFVQHHFY